MDADEREAAAIVVRRVEQFNLWPPTDHDRRTLTDAFLEQSASAFAAAGWATDPVVDPSTGVSIAVAPLGAFRRVIGEGFAARVLLSPANRRSPEDSAVVVRVDIGLAYLTLDRLMWLTTDRIVAGAGFVRDVRDIVGSSSARPPHEVMHA